MGNKLTCCLKRGASPRLRWHSGRVSRDDESDVCAAGAGNSGAVPSAATAPEPAELDLRACEGRRVLHLCDLEMPEELASDLIPSDHPRASTIFLEKSQVDVRGKRRKNYSYHVSLGHLNEKYSSCSTIFLDDSTICQPNLRITMQCLALAIYYHIKNREANRSEDIFDERLHPFTQETVPEEYFNQNPDPESIYRFIHPFFSATKLTAEYAITTLVYLERLVVYAEIDICPTNWKRIVLGAILLASKYLHDLAIWNSDFCQIIKGITVKDINEMERQYLYLLQFHLNVSASVYAKYYFDLRSLAGDHGLPIVFAPLRKGRAQTLEGVHKTHFPGIGAVELLHLPLGVKLPVISRSKILYYTMKLSEKLFQPSYGFNLTDPYCQLLGNQYNSLHDPHLRAYHSREGIRRRLKEGSHSPSNNEVG